MTILTPEERQKQKELIAKMAKAACLSADQMEDLVVEGRIVVEFVFNVKTGELQSRRVG